MSGISVCLITRNAGKTLDGCLASVKGLGGEIVVVDQFSNDHSREIAAKYGARIFERELDGFGAQKQFALDQANSEWVFLIDSDEAATPALLEEIRKAAASGPAVSAYRLARKNHYFGKWLKFGGQYPDYQTRLMKKSACRFSPDRVHEKVIVEGRTATLSQAILHYSYPDMETWVEKLKRFSVLRGEEWLEKGIRPSVWNFSRFCLARPSWRFFRRCFFKGGFLDGFEGLMACLHDVLTDVLGYCALREKSRSKAER